MLVKEVESSFFGVFEILSGLSLSKAEMLC